MKLYEHQQQALEQTHEYNLCAYYLDMGLGKTFVGSEKLIQLISRVNLVVCQKSKIDDWLQHFKTYYESITVLDLTNKEQYTAFTFADKGVNNTIGIINYDLVWRRPELKKLKDITLMLDESSLIQNEKCKRSKFILNLDAANVILLSGTPTGGKYEKLYSQLTLLGMKISKRSFYNMYVDYYIDNKQGFPLMIIKGYKNVERLKRKMRDLGCVFMKSEEVLTLPDQIFTKIKVKTTSNYKKFMENGIVRVHNKQSKYIELVGDTTLTKLLYARQLCGAYSVDKLKSFVDLVESTNDRLIVFYNFNSELEQLKCVCDDLERPYSVVNGECKDLYAYDNKSTSVTFIQYQAGAMGLNLQKSNKIIYFTPPLSSELYEQSKKRIHRIGQQNSCFYYNMVCIGSIEEKIYRTLEMRKDYTNALFESEV